jgi:ribulose 1,5-bisphosphate carboxylase large subunit-like protein
MISLTLSWLAAVGIAVGVAGGVYGAYCAGYTAGARWMRSVISARLLARRHYDAADVVRELAESLRAEIVPAEGGP